MLEAVQTKAYNLVTSIQFWMILVVIIIFLAIACYLYNKYVTPMIDTKFVQNNEYHTQSVNEEDSDSTRDKSVDLYIFTVQWCPHSKNAMPIWNELKEEYGGSNAFNGYKINFVEIDGEENPDLADKYKVEGYPTIKLLKGNQVIEYDAKPSKEHLREFLNSTLM